MQEQTSSSHSSSLRQKRSSDTTKTAAALESHAPSYQEYYPYRCVCVCVCVCACVFVCAYSLLLQPSDFLPAPPAHTHDAGLQLTAAADQAVQAESSTVDP